MINLLSRRVFVVASTSSRIAARCASSSSSSGEASEFPVGSFDAYRKPAGDTTRRAFNYAVVGGLSVGLATGIKALAVDFIDTMSASSDVLALANVEVNIESIKQGESLQFKWRGKPVYVLNRTPKEIDAARAVPVESLRDPQTDQQRVKDGKDNWLVLIGVCTHLGCVPQAKAGDFAGFYCPCHGSHYDTSGRIRKGPAQPRGAAVQVYQRLDGARRRELKSTSRVNETCALGKRTVAHGDARRRQRKAGVDILLQHVPHAQLRLELQAAQHDVARHERAAALVDDVGLGLLLLPLLLPLQ
jgi:ubiquinol-cytochrome c reductase iron-sulfur subunit